MIHVSLRRTSERPQDGHQPAPSAPTDPQGRTPKSLVRLEYAQRVVLACSARRLGNHLFSAV
eukprot:3025950-Pyramimonas_sp.AAC.1